MDRYVQARLDKLFLEKRTEEIAYSPILRAHRKYFHKVVIALLVLKKFDEALEFINGPRLYEHFTATYVRDLTISLQMDQQNEYIALRDIPG